MKQIEVFASCDILRHPATRALLIPTQNLSARAAVLLKSLELFRHGCRSLRDAGDAKDDSGR